MKFYSSLSKWISMSDLLPDSSSFELKYNVVSLDIKLPFSVPSMSEIFKITSLDSISYGYKAQR